MSHHCLIVPEYILQTPNPVLKSFLQERSYFYVFDLDVALKYLVIGKWQC